MSINKNNCNAVDITEKVRSDFENHSLVLVQVNGLRIEDNGVTWGIYLKFILYTIHVFHKEPQFYLRLTVFYFQINIYRVSLDYFLLSIIYLESISGKTLSFCFNWNIQGQCFFRFLKLRPQISASGSL